MQLNMNEAMLYETLLALFSARENEALRRFASLSEAVDVSRPLPEIVTETARVCERMPGEIQDAYFRVRHSFESYPFPFEIIRGDDERFARPVTSAPFLYAYGNTGLLDEEIVTVLGMRAPDEEGRLDAVSILQEAGKAGACVMSTLDTGLDAYCTRYAFNERMKQIVLLASPLHQCMPEGQKELMEQVASSPSSLLLTPFAPSRRAEKWFTVPRNQVLVSLSSFLVILEERDGGPLWKLAGQVCDEGGSVMLTASSLANDSFTQARSFAQANSVFTYKHRGDLKKHLAGAKSRPRKASDDGGQLELF